MVVIKDAGSLAPQGKAEAELVLTAPVVLKACGFIFLGVAGMYFLAAGKKDQSVQKMVFGAALIFGALFLFF